jgi:hypothetical protein
MYELTRENTVIRLSEGLCIPFDEGNSDYAAYQSWCAGGNTPMHPVANTEAVRAEAMEAIDKYHAETVQRLVGNPTQIEKDTWSFKLRLARNIASGQQLDKLESAFLTGAGLMTDDAISGWSQACLEKALFYARVIGIAEGLRDEARQAVISATSEEEISIAISVSRERAESAEFEME